MKRGREGMHGSMVERERANVAVKSTLSQTQERQMVERERANVEVKTL